MWMRLLEGKLVLITGASRGVGRHAAEAFAAAGARVVAGARSLEGGLDKAPPGGVVSVQLDVTDEASIARCFERVEALGSIDVLVNNAGAGTFAPVESLSAEAVRATLSTNTVGAFSCAREAFRHMKARGGRIINVGSIAATESLASNAAYGASKAALLPLTRSINVEGRLHRISATFLELGAVYTDLWKGLPDFSADDMLRLEDVSEALMFIASRPLHVRIDTMSLVPPKRVL